MRNFNLDITQARTVLLEQYAGIVIHDAELIEYCQAVIDGTFQPEIENPHWSEITDADREHAAGQGE